MKKGESLPLSEEWLTNVEIKAYLKYLRPFARSKKLFIVNPSLSALMINDRTAAASQLCRFEARK